MAREMPVKEYVRKKLETEKEKAMLDEIVASNNVTVPDDFTVPEVTEEQMQEMMQKQQEQQMRMQGPGAEGEAPGPPPGKADAKKPEAKKSK